MLNVSIRLLVTRPFEIELNVKEAGAVEGIANLQVSIKGVDIDAENRSTRRD